MTRLGGEFIPSLPEGDFAVDTRVLPGSNLKTSTDAVQKSSQILMKNSQKLKKKKIVGKQEAPKSQPILCQLTRVI